MRVDQTLDIVGDWYIAGKVLSHSDGSLGTPTIIEVHVVP
jgi:hypothetical protein